MRCAMPRADHAVLHRLREALEDARPDERAEMIQRLLPLATRFLGARRDAVAPRPARSLSAAAATHVGRRRTGVARQVHAGAGILAFAVLADSGLEHYRGMFANRAMFAPLAAATLTLGASAHGLLDRKPLSHRNRDAIYGLAAATGMVGTGFHVWNIGKRPGGMSFLNLFYAAPIGAPFALVLSGLLGLSAERLRDQAETRRRRVLGLPTDGLLAAISALGLVGTSGEAALLHFRGAFHNPAMYAPVLAPPLAAGLLSRAMLAPTRGRTRAARIALRLTTLLGFAGVGFHAFGIARNMGGWRNWTQNILAGPPLPAPPSFTGLALAGLAALRLRAREQGDD